MTAFVEAWWPLIVFAIGSIVASLRFLFAHAKKHQEIDARLEWGKERFDKNDGDHEEIMEKLEDGGAKLSAAVNGLRELLVHEGLRKPGEGINGEDT